MLVDALNKNTYATLLFLHPFFHELNSKICPSGTDHLKSVCLSHNALGSTGFELVLKTLPLHCLTRLDLSAVCRSGADHLPLQHLTGVLSHVRGTRHDTTRHARGLARSCEPRPQQNLQLTHTEASLPLPPPQDSCSLTHLSLAANGLTDGDVAALARCVCFCCCNYSITFRSNFFVCIF